MGVYSESNHFIICLGECMCILSNSRCLSLLKRSKNMKQLKQSHALVIKSGLGTDKFALSRLLAFCSDPHRGSLSYASKLFKAIQNPTLCICNTMIKALLLRNDLIKTVTTYIQMLRTGLSPDNYTLPYMLKASASLGICSLGESIHGHCVKLGMLFDIFVGNSLIFMYSGYGKMEAAGHIFVEMPLQTAVGWTIMISGYAKQGDVDAARLFFDEAPMVKDVGMWGSMISGYIQNNCFKEGLYMFRQMQSAGFTPDEPILVSILCACANLGALEIGIWIHKHLEKLGLPVGVRLGTALIDMYAKCGNLDLAKKVFDGIRQRDTVCWNAMISGMATHGHGEAALQLFEEMKQLGVRPDDLSFLAIFTACSHSGMAYEGLRVLDSMYREYNIVPKSEHIVCVVDLICRAGLFEEAVEIIRKVPTLNASEEAVAWRALLSACCQHGQSMLAEVAAQKLLQLERHSGVYLLLSNFYAATGKYDEAKSIRKKMTERGVNKAPGCSSIKINGVVHEFVVGEKTDPQLREINEVLEEMTKHLNYQD